MTDRNDDEFLGPEAMAKVLGVNKKTLLQLMRRGLAPAPHGSAKSPRWRWGAVRKWYRAMETLYGVGCVERIMDRIGPDLGNTGRNEPVAEKGSSEKKKPV